MIDTQQGKGEILKIFSPEEQVPILSIIWVWWLFCLVINYSFVMLVSLQVSAVNTWWHIFEFVGSSFLFTQDLHTRLGVASWRPVREFPLVSQMARKGTTQCPGLCSVSPGCLSCHSQYCSSLTPSLFSLLALAESFRQTNQSVSPPSILYFLPFLGSVYGATNEF